MVLSLLHNTDGWNIISIIDYRFSDSPSDSIWWSHHHQLYLPIPSAVGHAFAHLMCDETTWKDRGFRWVRNSFQFPHHLENYICLTFSWVRIHSSWPVLQSILWLPSANCVDAVRIKYFTCGTGHVYCNVQYWTEKEKLASAQLYTCSFSISNVANVQLQKLSFSTSAQLWSARATHVDYWAEMEKKLHRIILGNNLQDCNVSDVSISGHVTQKWSQSSKRLNVIVLLFLKPSIRNLRKMYSISV